MTRDQIQAHARLWLDVPFKERGRDRKGIDCIGLCVVNALFFHVPFIDDVEYEHGPDRQRRLVVGFDKYLVRAKQGSPFPGSLGVYSAFVLPVHCGIFSLKHGQVHAIHARGDIGYVTEDPYRPQDLPGRLIGRWVYPGLEE